MINYIPASQLSLEGFKTPFDNKLDSHNRWVVMASMIPWDKLAGVYYRHLSASAGAPTLSARMMIGAVIIKHVLNVDDREVVQQIQENIYLQYFVGLSSFQIEPAFDPSLLVLIRKRLGKDVMDQFNALIVKEGEATAEKAIPKPKVPKTPQTDKEDKPGDPMNPNSGTLMVDATVAEQQIRYPTDVNLLNDSRENLERIISSYCSDHDQEVPRMYPQVARRKYLRLAKKKHKTKEEIRRAIRQQLQYVRRDLGYMNALAKADPSMMQQLTKRDSQLVEAIQKTYQQQLWMYKNKVHSIADRIISIYQPHVRPIPRGKDRVSTEFGSKQMIMLKDGFTQVRTISWDNFNEGVHLIECLEAYRSFYGCYPEKVLGDQLFGNRENRAFMKQKGIRYVGKALGRPTQQSKDLLAGLQKEMSERNAIEGKFGQGKNAYGLAKIKARLKDTSESWISAIYFVMNILNLVQVHFLLFFYNLLRLPCLIGRISKSKIVRKLVPDISFRFLPVYREQIF